MAPEVFLAGKGTSTSSDAWSLGITLIKFIAKKEAWAAEGSGACDMETLHKFLETKLMPPTLSHVLPLYRDHIALLMSYEHHQPVIKVLKGSEKIIL